jgi:hypothetical protein
VDAVRKAIEIDTDWDIAENRAKLHFYILRTAQNAGRFESFTPDEVALNLFLADRVAGKRLCDYAFGGGGPKAHNLRRFKLCSFLPL